MREAVLYGGHNICFVEREDPKIIEPTTHPMPMGHEYRGVVVEVGSAVRTIKPGKVFDLTLPLAQVAEGYCAMDECRAIKRPTEGPEAAGTVPGNYRQCLVGLQTQGGRWLWTKFIGSYLHS
jgi:threonine dehydrogenase-like Zn-dependent dehydrogenase